MNLLIQKGNITRPLELRYTPSGQAVVEIGLAVNRKWKDRETGEVKEKVTFTDWRAWGRQAENVVKYFSKGSPILLTGRLEQEMWEDKETGKKRSKSLGIVDSFEFCGEARRAAPEPPEGHRSSGRTMRGEGEGRPPAPVNEGGGAMGDDDIPF